MHSQQDLQARKQQAWRHMGKGRYAAAVELLKEASSTAPNDAESRYLLGCALASLGRWNEAISALQFTIQLQPNVAQSHYALAGAWIALGQLDAAIDCLHTTLKLSETMTDAHVALANLQISQGSIDDARSHLERAVALDPRMSDAHLGLGAIEQERGDYLKALPHFEHALKCNSHNLKAMCAIATTLANLTQKNQAKSYYRKALHIDPNCVDALSGLALIYNFNGEYAKAIQLINPLLEKKVSHSTVGVAFAQACKHGNRCEEAVTYINQVLQQPGLTRSQQKTLHFEAGKLLDIMGNYEAAFAHFKAGNEVKKLFYDSVAHTQRISELINFFTAEFFMRVPPAGNTDKRPVFIIGMPRSGTSLTEQILAAHPQVFAAGELDTLSTVAENMRLELGCSTPFPDYLDKLNQGQIDAMANNYLARLTGLSKQAARITDKMPHNFYLLGLIQLLFPDSRIIHCTRDPRDTGLSIYFQDFHEGHAYARDLFNIGTHYHQYLRLMDHWKQVVNLPILDVSYEDLVADQKNMTQRILEFCELDWNDRCLQFHNVKRTIDTASNDQVRQPLYTKSVQRWKHYEPFLNDLQTGLERDF